LAFVFAHFEGNWGGRGVDVGIGAKGVDDRGKVVDAEKRRAEPCFGFSCRSRLLHIQQCPRFELEGALFLVTNFLRLIITLELFSLSVVSLSSPRRKLPIVLR
jgi:hypothetical protein